MSDTYPNISELRHIATKFRGAILRIPADQRLGGLRNFPNAACCDATWLLGTYLNDRGLNGFAHIVGERGNFSDNTRQLHAWLQYKQLVVDITADQFSDVSEEVIVEIESQWHQQFSISNSLDQDFRDHLVGGGVDDHLFAMYEEIVRSIELL